MGEEMGMRLDLELSLTQDEGLEPALGAPEVEGVLRAVLADRDVTRPCAVSVSYVSDEEIARLNERWRGVARATDVLSFECERPDDPALAEGEPCELGDIVLAPAYVADQAARMGTTSADETRLLLVHGCLHLLGYDHEEPSEAAEMQRVEDAILAALPGDGTLSAPVLASHREEESA
jgi:probable rRNA maturation factor